MTFKHPYKRIVKGTYNRYPQDIHKNVDTNIITGIIRDGSIKNFNLSKNLTTHKKLCVGEKSVKLEFLFRSTEYYFNK